MASTSSALSAIWGFVWIGTQARNGPRAFYRPPAFSIALMMILLASSPDRLVTVKCATDCRRRVFFFASTEISVICIATRGALRSTIVMFRSFSFAKISPPINIGLFMSFSRPRQTWRWYISAVFTIFISCEIQQQYGKNKVKAGNNTAST